MFLLDTHVWLWSLLDSARLSTKAQDVLSDPEAALHLSSVSLWESLLLAERGRIVLEPGPTAWLRKAMAASPLAEVPLSMDVVMASTSVHLPHRDPADRLIAATAKSRDLTLLTADRRLIACKDIRVLAI